MMAQAEAVVKVSVEGGVITRDLSGPPPTHGELGAVLAFSIIATLNSTLLLMLLPCFLILKKCY